ncbi:MAG: DNRLRE domain-containing protein [Ruminococcaceae bacterium]|nr:DNRLRE domain-containing protein [Oscillospiraceae bacterium]
MKATHKVLSLALSFILLFSFYPGSVAEASDSPYLYSTDFDTDDGHAEYAEGINDMVISGGMLSVTRPEESNRNFTDRVKIYYSEDKSPCEESKISVEFAVKRSESKKMSFDFCDSNQNVITSLRFQTNDSVSLYYRTAENASPVDKVLYNDAKINEMMAVKVNLNHTTQRMSVWIDGTSIVTDAFYAEDAGNFQSMDLIMRGENYHTVSLDYFRVGIAEATEEEKVEMDYQWLTYGTFGKEPQNAVTGKISLPETGKNGSAISWGSSNSAVIATDGTVTRPSDADADVTLTATITLGENTKTKTFDITVLKESAKKLPTAEKGYLIEDDMTGNSFSDRVSVLGGMPVPTEAGAEMAQGDSFAYLLRSDGKGEVNLLAFNLQISGDGTAVEFYDDTETVCFSLKTQDNSLLALTRSSDGAENITDKDWSLLKQGLFDRPVTVVLDPVSGIFSLWYGSDMLADGRLGAEDCSKIDKIVFRQEEGSALISGIRAYYPTLDAESSLSFDAAAVTVKGLSWQKNDHITEDLDFPEKGASGSLIAWSSNNESVITSDGTVNAVTGGTATLTAVFSNGEKTLTKEFVFNVPALGEREFPEVKTPVFIENFDKNSSNVLLDDLTENGIYYLKNEKMHVLRTENVNTDQTRMDMYFDQMQQSSKGIYSLEFTIGKSEHTWGMAVVGTKEYFRMTWYDNGRMVLFGDDTIPEANVSAGNFTLKNSQGQTAFYTDTIKMRILMDTNRSNYSLWINDELVVKNKSSRFSNHGNIKYIKFWTGAIDAHMELDNVKFYESYPIAEDRIRMDKEWLIPEQFLNANDPSAVHGYVSRDMNLPLQGIYGSKISWTTSNPDVISADGKVMQTDSLQTVTLTATIEAGNLSDTDEFTFNVSPVVTEDSSAVEKDLQNLTEELLSPNDDPSDGIKHSLSLTDTGMYGSSITWVSDNENYITGTGRVTQPRCDQEDTQVTLTATVSRGGITATKELTFTVLADEEFVDPQHMTDEEFFGVYSLSENRWITEGKWDYSYNSSMQKIGEAVKNANGDYTEAKKLLLNYFQNERKNTSTLSSGERNTGWANMITDGFQHLQRTAYYRGDMTVGKKWDSYATTINADGLAKSGTMVFTVRAWYNEDTYVEFARSDAENVAMRPRLELTVNGEERTFYASDDAMVRAGVYGNENYADSEYIKVRNYGEFLGDGLEQGFIKFDLSELSEEDTISKANLVLYAHAGPDFAEEKRLIILYEPNANWTRENAIWDNMIGYIYSFNGLPDEPRWENIPGCDVEYWSQFTRFYCWPAIAVEYQMTGDETYAYKAQRIVESFITDTGGYTSGDASGTYAEDGIRGIYNSGLAAAIRIPNWLDTLPVLIKSEYATPDFCTAWLKNIWDYGNFITYYRSPPSNALQYQMQALMDMALLLPEFKDSRDGRNWYATSVDTLNETIFTNTMNDGSYFEASDAYGGGALSEFVAFKRDMMSGGIGVSEEYDQRLHDLAYYQALLYSTDGVNPQYGDSGLGKRDASAYTQIYKWFDDKELEYIVTFGKSGKEPSWTSRAFTDSTVATLRANWSKNSPWLFTQARGGGPHGHEDYNAIVLRAYGRTLLIDSGYFSYAKDDPYSVYGDSTKAHNTVLVNDTSQQSFYNAEDKRATYGTTNEFVTNSAFDYLSQTTPNNPGVNHTRIITFIKPGLFIVSDLMEPEDNSVRNNYKQIWHMYPEAKISISPDSDIVRSNYTSGSNVILASADGNTVETKKELGWCARSYAKVEEAPFAYFEKVAAGTTSLDTVIMPTNDDTTASVTAQKLSSRTNTTAIKIDMVQYGSAFTGYFYLSHDGEGGSFGPYETDAQLAYVQLDAEGNVCGILVKDGSFIKESESGSVVFESDQQHNDVYVDMTGTNTYITGDAQKLTNTRILHTKQPKKVFINNVITTYNAAENYISSFGNGEQNGTDSQGQGKVEGITGAGGGGGGGDEDKTPDEAPEEPKEPETTDPDESESSVFADVTTHWAKENIEEMQKKGVVNGDADGLFHPDRNITRAEFVAIAVRSQGWNEKSYRGRFTDVKKDAWYADIVQTALDYGIISADNNFRPDDPITREEMAKIISIISNTDNEFSSSAEIPYTDLSEISQWAIDYVRYVTDTGLMQGRNNGSFDPKANATRAESAAVISRMLKKNSDS